MSALPERAAARPLASRPGFDAALAWLFVVIWGSGFVATKVALQYTSPFVLLSLRYLFGIACLGLVALVVPLRWPERRRDWMHVVVAGLLIHAISLGGSHYGQYLGLSAGTTALILGAQPLSTAFVAALWLDERLAAPQWLGIALGLAGVTLVVWHKIDVHAMSGASLAAVVISMVGATAGALYQRRFCRHIDLRAASLIQFGASLAVLLPLALIFEGWHVRWSWALLGAIAYLVIGASIVALNAFHILMRRGEATRVASLLYLTPVIAVILEYCVFQVVPTLLSLGGMVIVCAGVALVALRPRAAARAVKAQRGAETG